MNKINENEEELIIDEIKDLWELKNVIFEKIKQIEDTSK